MQSLTPDEARERFGPLVHQATRTYREFEEQSGIWRPVIVDGELTSYRLYTLRKLPKTRWPRR